MEIYENNQNQNQNDSDIFLEAFEILGKFYGDYNPYKDPKVQKEIIETYEKFDYGDDEKLKKLKNFSSVIQESFGMSVLVNTEYSDEDKKTLNKAVDLIEVICKNSGKLEQIKMKQKPNRYKEI